MKASVYLLWGTLLLASPAYASVEKGESVIYDAKTGMERARLHYEWSTGKKDGKNYCRLEIRGSGAIDKYKNASWRQEAALEEKNGLMFVLHTRCEIRNREGHILADFEKDFDYARGRIIWISRNAAGFIIKRVIFPLRGMTTDDIGLVYFLTPFVTRHKEAPFRSFYLISNEPNMYKTNVRIMRHEILDLPAGPRLAIKIKLTGDVGILETVLDKFVLPTYVWFDEKAPGDWLQYQGFEKSLHSPYIRGEIVKRTTSDLP